MKHGNAEISRAMISLVTGASTRAQSKESAEVLEWSAKTSMHQRESLRRDWRAYGQTGSNRRTAFVHARP